MSQITPPRRINIRLLALPASSSFRWTLSLGPTFCPVPAQSNCNRKHQAKNKSDLQPPRFPLSLVKKKELTNAFCTTSGWIFWKKWHAHVAFPVPGAVTQLLPHSHTFITPRNGHFTALNTRLSTDTRRWVFRSLSLPLLTEKGNSPQIPQQGNSDN